MVLGEKHGTNYLPCTTEYPIPENKRISKYKEKWCA